MKFEHFPVMLNECVDALNIKPNGVYIDCTLGGGGHSYEILKRLNSDGKLIAIDQDDYSIKYCVKKFEGIENIKIIKGNFENINFIIKSLDLERVDGILMDLGVSSHQIDTEDRGFSYMRNSVLDMRMDRSNELTAESIINTYSEERLSEIFKIYGEERYHKKIASSIIKRRNIKPIRMTFDLVEIIDKVIPGYESRIRGHSSKKVFQALRIEVNRELEILENSIIDSINSLSIGGRIVIITFHSLEDKIVKKVFKYLSMDCICSKDLPICCCSKKKEINILNKKPISPSLDELKVNSRSSSAKLRVAEKV